MRFLGAAALIAYYLGLYSFKDNLQQWQPHGRAPEAQSGCAGLCTAAHSWQHGILSYG